MRISSIFLPLALLLASATSAQADNQITAPTLPANFGNPPSGEIPILYNDHTVYSKPDILRRNRVLAAFIKNHQIYVPLRSMFEQMGATVTASADGKTFLATKTGTRISVRLGSSEVNINGEARPLDVPPILYRGVILVPVRVISEALGAYVLWVSNRHLVVVRYLAAVAPPTPGPISAPIIQGTPAPAPAATPEPNRYNGFIAVAKSHSRNYNEFSAGQFCPYDTLIASAAYMFKKSPFAIKGDYREDGFVSSINTQDAFGAYFTQF
nr:copper amine oxidase N-terminal domain-containing protein [Candidatus Eremiobacteraeota bacterium]